MGTNPLYHLRVERLDITKKDILERQQKPYVHDYGNQRLKRFGFLSYDEFMKELESENNEKSREQNF